MNILFIENALRPTRGGVERVTFTLFNGLINVGHKCYIYFREDDFDGVSADNKYRQHNLSGIYEQLEACIKRWDIHVLICQNLHTKEYQQAYARIRNEHKVKIISVLHSNPDIWVNKNKWGCTFPKIYFKELLRSVLFRIKGNPYKEQMLGMYNISDRYVLLSESFKKVFCDLYKVDGRKLYAIGNPCAFSDDLDCRNEKENIVVVVARMAEQQKRISNVLQIWAKAQNKVPEWNLCIVGDGPDLEEYKRFAQRNNLKNVTFVGASNEPEVYYKRAKIFMMTSIWEGFGMTLIEAQHYGCIPFVFNTYAAVNDIIHHGVNGFIIPAHAIDEYVNSLVSLMGDERKQQIMKYNCIESARNIHDKKVIVNKWNDCMGGNDIKDNIVLVVARMSEQQKRISNVLKVWKSVQHDNPLWKLEIIGDGPDLSLYKKMARDMHMHNIYFLGGSEQPEIYYKRAKIFMMTSIWEGYPMTLIEAQHYGCVPIVYDSFAAVHDLIKDDINGKIIPLHNIQLYASQLNMLMNTPQSLYNLSVAAIRYSNERYHKEIVLNDWGSLFEELEIL